MVRALLMRLSSYPFGRREQSRAAQIAGVIFGDLPLTGRLRLGDEKPPQEQPPSPEKHRPDPIKS
jgi:hypothetical protein